MAMTSSAFLISYMRLGVSVWRFSSSSSDLSAWSLFSDTYLDPFVVVGVTGGSDASGAPGIGKELCI